MPRFYRTRARVLTSLCLAALVAAGLASSCSSTKKQPAAGAAGAPPDAGASDAAAGTTGQDAAAGSDAGGETNVPPDAQGEFRLVTPTDGAMVVDTRQPELEWEAVAGAVRYEVWINVTRPQYDWNASGNLLDRYTKVAEITGATTYQPDALPDRWTYKWHVVAVTSDTQTLRSDIGTFSVYLPELEQEEDGVPIIDGARDLNKNGTIEPFEDWKQPVATRVDDLMSRLTDEEKALQLFYNFKESPMAGWQMGPIGNPAEIRDWLLAIGQNNRVAIPFVTAGDTTHGYQTTFPTGIGVAATLDPDLAYQLADMERKELLVSGQRGILGPIAEVGTMVAYPRIQEGFGENADVAAAMTRAAVAGLQGGPEINPRSVVPTTKHWPGEGAGGEGGIVYDAVTIKWHMKPWFAAIEANTGSIMPGYAGSNFLDPPDNSCSTPCGEGQVCFKGQCLYGGHGGGDSHALIDYLRTTMKYDGVVTTDWLPSGAWVGAANAGSDVMGGADPNAADFSIADFIAKVPKERLDQATSRVLSLKIRMGLFENPYPDMAGYEATWKAPEHKELAIKATEKSLTLLRNEGALPLTLGSGDVIVVAGPAAVNKNDAFSDAERTWNASSNFYSIWTSYYHGTPGQSGPVDSMFKGIAERAAQAGVSVVAPGDAAASSAKAVVLGLGEPSYTHAVYWHDNQNEVYLTLSADQLALIDAYADKPVPVIAVLILPRPMLIADWHERVDSLVVAYRPGDGVGMGVGRFLFGDVTPNGTLPFQLPRSEDQVRTAEGDAVEQHDLPYDLGASDEERSQIRALIDAGEAVPTTFGDPLYPYGAGMRSF